MKKSMDQWRCDCGAWVDFPRTEHFHGPAPRTLPQMAYDALTAPNASFEVTFVAYDPRCHARRVAYE